MKHLLYKNENDVTDVVNFNRIVVNPETKNKFINIPRTLYRVENIVFSSQEVTTFPSTINLTFDGIIEKTNGSAVIETTTQSITQELEINDYFDLIGTFWWNGVPISYEFEKV